MRSSPAATSIRRKRQAVRQAARSPSGQAARAGLRRGVAGLAGLAGLAGITLAGWAPALVAADAVAQSAAVVESPAAPAAPTARPAAPELLVPDLGAVPFADPGSSLPPSWKRGPFAQIHVRAYQDSNGDGVGDLRGLISRLDHLKALGVRGLWLMPISASQDGDHGYAVENYRGIEADYGSLADFDELLRQAHARGMGVILDYVMNHSAAEHPLFRNALRGPGNRFRDWYIWQDRDPGGWNVLGNNPWRPADTSGGPASVYYAGFAYEMPEFNLRKPAVVAWHEDNLRFWLNRGVDGFRFDAVGNLFESGPLAWESQPESHALMHRIRALVDGYANRYMVCEAPGDALGFAAAASAGSSFYFGHQNRIIAAALGSPSAVEQLAQDFVNVPLDGLAVFASNHDSFAGPRLWDRVRGDPAAYRLAAATYLLQPGVPFIYYGEEIGLAGAKRLSGDHKLRTPMSWTADPETAGFTTGEPFRQLSSNVATHNVAAQQADPASLLNFYKGLIALRHARPSLAAGSYQRPLATGWTLSFQRISSAEGAAQQAAQQPAPQPGQRATQQATEPAIEPAPSPETTLVVFNYGAQPATAPLSGLPARARLSLLWSETGAAKLPATQQTDAQGRASLRLPPQSVSVWAVAARP